MSYNSGWGGGIWGKVEFCIVLKISITLCSVHLKTKAASQDSNGDYYNGNANKIAVLCDLIAFLVTI